MLTHGAMGRGDPMHPNRQITRSYVCIYVLNECGFLERYWDILTIAASCPKVFLTTALWHRQHEKAGTPTPPSMQAGTLFLHKKIIQICLAYLSDPLAAGQHDSVQHGLFLSQSSSNFPFQGSGEAGPVTSTSIAAAEPETEQQRNWRQQTWPEALIKGLKKGPSALGRGPARSIYAVDTLLCVLEALFGLDWTA